MPEPKLFKCVGANGAVLRAGVELDTARVCSCGVYKKVQENKMKGCPHTGDDYGTAPDLQDVQVDAIVSTALMASSSARFVHSR